MQRKPIRLAIVDDNSLFRKTLETFLREQQDITVVLQTADIRELFRKLKETSIDLLIIDIFLPGLEGLEVFTTIQSEYPLIRILVLSMNRDLDIISNLLDAGIHGYISKKDEPEELLEAIYAIADNRIYRNKIFTEGLYWNRQHSTKPFIKDDVIPLNDREKRLLQLLWDEKSNKEIANELFLGIRSVEKIRQEMKEKIGVKSTVGLLKYAINKMIIDVKPANTIVIQRDFLQR